MANKEVLTTSATELKHAASPEDLQQVLALESLAFGGEGEDIYSLAMIAKVGWILALSQKGSSKFLGAVELVPTKQRDIGFIHGVVVNPEAQSSGTGVALIAHAEKVATEAGIQRIEATIAPTNGASLNAFLNKSAYRATHFYPNFYGEGEHRFWVTKDLTIDQAMFDEEHWRDLYATQAYPNQHILVKDNDYESLARLINDDNYHVVGVIRPEKSGENQNLLYLIHQPPQEVTPTNE